MLISKSLLIQISAVAIPIVLLPIQPLDAQTSGNKSDSDRMEKLERAVEQLQKRNAELEQEISNLKKTTAFAPEFGPEAKTKTRVTSEGKAFVEKAVVSEEKKPVYVVPAGPEYKLVLGGFIQANFARAGFDHQVAAGIHV